MKKRKNRTFLKPVIDRFIKIYFLQKSTTFLILYEFKYSVIYPVEDAYPKLESFCF